MLKFGEFSPNNPKMRIATQPYLGLGEYEQRRQLLLDQRKAEYQQYAEKVKRATERENTYIKNNFKGSRPVSNSRSNSVDKSVQTDIQNVNTKLVQYESSPRQNSIEKQKSPRSRGVNIDKVQIQTQNNIIVPGYNKYLDKVGVIKSNSPRAKLMADLQSSYFPTVMGCTPRGSEDDDKMEKARRQEKYLAELRQQIEEKQSLLQKHKEQEKYQQEIATRKLESQIRELNTDDIPSLIGRQSYSSELPVTMNRKEFDNKSDQTSNRNSRWNEKRLKSRMLNTSATSYSDLTDKRNTSKFTNSPPLKRDRPPYSFNIPPNSVFAKALPVKEKINKTNSKLALNINNSNLTTTKDTPLRVMHSNTNKLEETLPIPVLKAQSPVAKELINALPVQSKTSDAMRKLEDKWQIPAVQKNIIKNSERLAEGNNQGILTQLGAIRLQLQQEQLRLDETLRKRGTSQTVVQADVHHNLN